MKIGILTFHKSINYGSVLQAWALSRQLKEMGYEIEIIDYKPRVYSFMYDLYRKSNSLKNIKYNLNRILISKSIKKQIELFNIFQTRNMNLSKQKYFYDSNLEVLNEKYDVIICGSDQIWNVHAYDCDPIYFLPFHFLGKKIAYAVSVNDTEFNEIQCTNELKKQILDFDFISAREESGTRKISNFINYEKKVFTTLDPTLLHAKNVYETITSERIINQPYIFLYNIWSQGDVVDIVVELSEKIKLPIYTAMMSRDTKTILQKAKKGIITERKHLSPSDFLSLIKYADYVVTDSFHGTAFSLIFEKKFICINGKGKDGQLKNDERIVNILKQLDLEDRYIIKDKFSDFDINNEINYEEVNKKRMTIASKSIELLRSAIQE